MELLFTTGKKTIYLNLLPHVFQSLVAEARMLEFVFRRVQEAKLHINVNEKCQLIKTREQKEKNDS